MNQIFQIWWFTTVVHKRGASIYFKDGKSPYGICNLENLINKLTMKYIYLYNLFIVRGLETNDNYLKKAW